MAKLLCSALKDGFVPRTRIMLCQCKPVKRSFSQQPIPEPCMVNE